MMTTTIIIAAVSVVSTILGSSAIMVTRLITAILVGTGTGTTRSITAMAHVGAAIIPIGITTGPIPITATAGVRPTIIMADITAHTMVITALIMAGAAIMRLDITLIAALRAPEIMAA